MSAWPQAVWIVKRLQKNFNFTSQLDSYRMQLNNSNLQINNLIDRVAEDENRFNQVINNLESRTVTFVSTATNNGSPSTPPSFYEKGTIWLVAK